MVEADENVAAWLHQIANRLEGPVGVRGGHEHAVGDHHVERFRLEHRPEKVHLHETNA